MLYALPSVFLRRSIVLLAASLTLAGCSVSKERLKVESNPAGAFVYLNNDFVGTTPLNRNVNREIPYRVELRKPGYVTQTVQVAPTYTARGSSRPFLVVGPLEKRGFYVRLQPNPVEVTLRPEEGFVPQPEAETWQQEEEAEPVAAAPEPEAAVEVAAPEAEEVAPPSVPAAPAMSESARAKAEELANVERMLRTGQISAADAANLRQLIEQAYTE